MKTVTFVLVFLTTLAIAAKCGAAELEIKKRPVVIIENGEVLAWVNGEWVQK